MPHIRAMKEYFAPYQQRTHLCDILPDFVDRQGQNLDIWHPLQRNTGDEG
jgi:hypothetical protein